jgi:catechol 2,3-dioxygenase-like lactoylglutathione lyase family enzyme
MKRFHVHVGVSNISESIRFYTQLFGAAPTVSKSDYAKWLLDDPSVNFAISSRDGAIKGIEHIGIQSQNEDELAEVYDRLKSADRPVLEEGATTCCYAQSEKSWIADPDGVIWEAFLTKGDSTVYGGNPMLDQLVSANANENACCTPVAPHANSCTPSIAPVFKTGCC